MAMFSPWVQLLVKTTCSGSQENSRAACSRQAKTCFAASMAAPYPPRPGLAQVVIACNTPRYTPAGLGKEVAP